MSLFQNSVLNKYLKGLESEKVTQAYERFTSHFHNPTIQENIRNSKEEQYQGEFLIDLFVNVLGYTKNPTPEFNLTTELKNIKGSKKTDGAILKGEKALAVIELKGTNTTDLSKVETQAFGYKNNQPGCNYVITSNYEKLRFYIDNSVDFEEFNLFQLTKDRFEILCLCLSSEYLLKDIPKKIKDESLTQEENVTKKLYKDYASFRNEIFDAIRNENTEYDKLTLFKKTQKLLDRFLFIFFAEDRLLLPPNSIRAIVNQWTDLRDKYDEYFPLYDRFKKYFGYMNTGHKGQQHDIFAYNGGLFAPDEILDNIKINDDLLYKHTLNLSNYDFESEVSVNILGHIFEHSLNDIEEIQNEIEGISNDQSKSKRKKDGVFYTPKYITKYIVDNTVGKLCEEKKAELDIQEDEYEKERRGRQKATLKKLTQKLEDYRNWLLQITICDPACGSGAFLNQALEFLIAEHQYIDELQAKLFGDAMILSEVENSILENNIFGVDINEESVDIAKLSLWLRTAQKGRKLTSLNSNIKCGNSLIDDPTVAGDKAFHWQKEFPEVFKEKNKKAYHITTALHDSRTSQRMLDYKVRERRDLGTNPLPNYTKLTTKEEIDISNEIIAIAEDKQLNIMAYNICADHIHILLVCEEEEVSTIVKTIKGRTARVHNSNKGINPLVQKENEKSVSLWTQKYGCKEIEDDTQLHNTVHYIQKNRQKHELPTNKELESLVNNPILNKTYEHAFAPAYKGGFDVVIGNPPYVNIENVDDDSKKFLFDYYTTTKGRTDLYIAFTELIFKIIKRNSLAGIIIPFSITNQNYAELIRRKILNEYGLLKIVDTSDYYVFEEAVVKTVILILSKKLNTGNTIIHKSLKPYSLTDKMHKIPQSTFLELNKAVFETKPITNLLGLKTKIEKQSILLEDICLVAYGVRVNNKNDKSKPKSYYVSIKKQEGFKKFVEGKDIERYSFNQTGYLNYKPDEHYNPMFSELFENEKLMFINVVSDKVRFSYDKSNFYNSHTIINCVKIDKLGKAEHRSAKQIIKDKGEDTAKVYQTKFLLGIVNSKLLNWYFFNFQSEGLHFYPDDAKKFPIINIDINYNQNNLINKVEIMLDINNNFKKLSNSFKYLFESKFTIEKPSKKLQNWHELSFGEFLKELKKNKVQLSLSEEAEWMQYFNEQKQKAEALKTEIDKTDKEIDQMVYELYGLTEEEIKIVEEATA